MPPALLPEDSLTSRWRTRGPSGPMGPAPSRGVHSSRGALTQALPGSWRADSPDLRRPPVSSRAPSDGGGPRVPGRGVAVAASSTPGSPAPAPGRDPPRLRRRRVRPRPRPRPRPRARPRRSARQPRWRPRAARGTDPGRTGSRGRGAGVCFPPSAGPAVREPETEPFTEGRRPKEEGGGRGEPQAARGLFAPSLL